MTASRLSYQLEGGSFKAKWYQLAIIKDKDKTNIFSAGFDYRIDALRVKPRRISDS
jgi:hypothetical protein